MMKVTYTLTVDDWMANKRLAGQRTLFERPDLKSESRRQRRYDATISCLVIGGPLLALPGSIYYGLHIGAAFYAVAFLCGVVLVLFSYAVYKQYSGKAVIEQFAANEKNAGPCTMEVLPTGLSYGTPLWRAEIEWTAILRVADTDGLLLIVDDTPRMFIVPKRAFATADEQQGFIDGLILGLHSTFKSGAKL